MNVILVYFTLKYKGNWDSVYKALETKEKVSLDAIKNIESWLSKAKWKVISILDDEYPEKLKSSHKPPFVFWIKGDCNLLKNKLTCVLGTTNIVKNNEFETLIKKLQKFGTILFLPTTNLYLELRKKRFWPSVILINSGINNFMDFEIKSSDLIISPHPPDFPKQEDKNVVFLKYLSLISDQAISFSNEINSLSFVASQHILNQSKKVYSILQKDDKFDGNQELIRQGAYLVNDIFDIEKL